MTGGTGDARAGEAGDPPSPAQMPLRLVVLGDSTAFTDARGPQLPGHPGLYPTVLAAELAGVLDREVDLQVVAQPGQTVRDAARAVTKEQHLQFKVLARADAVVVGLGSFDHAPAGIPPSIEAVVPYLRPSARRRRVRGMLRAAYPHLVRCTGGRFARTPPSEFDRRFSLLLTQIRGLTQGRAAGVVLGPTSHASAYYGHRHPGHPAAERRQLALAREHGFAAVACWPLVRPAVHRLNVDGIHWPADVHARVGHALATALLPQLTGQSPPIGLPGDTSAR